MCFTVLPFLLFPVVLRHILSFSSVFTYFKFYFHYVFVLHSFCRCSPFLPFTAVLSQSPLFSSIITWFPFCFRLLPFYRTLPFHLILSRSPLLSNVFFLLAPFFKFPIHFHPFCSVFTLFQYFTVFFIWIRFFHIFLRFPCFTSILPFLLPFHCFICFLPFFSFSYHFSSVFSSFPHCFPFNMFLTLQPLFFVYYFALILQFPGKIQVSSVVKILIAILIKPNYIIQSIFQKMSSLGKGVICS